MYYIPDPGVVPVEGVTGQSAWLVTSDA